MRVNGFASGMDIDYIVKQMMMAERVPLDKMEQRKQILEWQQETYRDLNSKFMELRSTSFNMRLQASFTNRNTIVDSGAGFTVSAGGAAGLGTHSLKVIQLATSAQLVSDSSVGAGSRDVKLSELKQKDDPDAPIVGDDVPLTITIRGDKGEAVIELNSSDTIAQAVQKINKETSKTGVTVNYDETLDRFFFTTSTTGKDSEISITASGADDDEIAANTAIIKDIFKLDVLEENGQNAEIEYNGIAGSYSSNTFTINGMTFTATRADATTAYNVTVTNDSEKTIENIKKFVNLYNEVIEEVNGLLSEKRNRGYAPLTELQKEEMSEREIELWEEKARSGLLRNDSILSNALWSFRSALMTAVEGMPAGDIKLLNEIGITTGSYSEKGKLHIDEDKLRTAVEQRPNEVMALFTSDDGDKNSSAGDGIAVRFVQQADRVLEALRNRALHATESTIEKELKNLEDRMHQFNMRLAQRENRYYAQFTQMEKYMNEMNQQSNYLMQMFYQA